jgi:hypothetical protein
MPEGIDWVSRLLSANPTSFYGLEHMRLRTVLNGFGLGCEDVIGRTTNGRAVDVAHGNEIRRDVAIPLYCPDAPRPRDTILPCPQAGFVD